MSVIELGLQVQGDKAPVGVKVHDLVHGDSDAGKVVIPGSGVIVPDGDDEALPNNVVDADKLEGVVPNWIKGLVHSLGLKVILLEPGLGVLLANALFLVQEVDQGIGILTSLAKKLAS